MHGIIHLLPDHVANQIAAGEVVQRPASVVKELIENAVDAKATDIKLIIKDAGKTLIQIIDNGAGMNVTDARMCFERHATSKIKSAEDLFELHTKGFRGEALASIAAVAHIELNTKQETDELGTKIIIEGSKFITQEPKVLPKGTSFLVKNLFFNIPARRNFLKSDNIELKHCIDEFQRVALAHPTIGFTMIHNGAELFNLPISNLRQRIVNTFGGKTNDMLVPIEEVTDLVEIKGYIGKPEFAKQRRNEQFFFVNNRFIKSSFLHYAVLNAYDGLVKETLQPSYFLHLSVPTQSIDINIHPTKTEIKFDDEQALYAILRASIKHSLGQFNVAPSLDFERDNTLDLPYTYKNKPSETPTIQVNSAYNPFKTNEKPSKLSLQSWEEVFQQSNQASNQFIEKDWVVGSLFNEENETEVGTKSFQFQKKYIVSYTKSGLLLVHQNRAHQRILYEQFIKNVSYQNAPSQKLLFPLELKLTTEEFDYFLQIQVTLTQFGFSFDVVENQRIVVSGLPIDVSETEVFEIFSAVFDSFSNEFSSKEFSIAEKIAKSLAQNLALKTGKYLTENEQEHLINELFSCSEPSVSPFLKPIFKIISTEELEF